VNEDEEEEKLVRNRFVVSKIQVPHECRVCDGPLVIGGPIWN